MNARHPKLKYQLRQCANCLKPESCNRDGEKLKTCARCKIARYCDAQCQKKDWPRHKLRCELQDAQAMITEEIDEQDADILSQTKILPMQSVNPLLHEWLLQYRPLFCFSLLRGQGYWDLPPSRQLVKDTPQVFYIKMTSVRDISQKTKARAAFRIDDAEFFPISELRIAAKERGHRLYDQDVQAVVDDFDQHIAYATSSGKALNPNYRLCMVLHRVYFHNSISAMVFHKNWYFEDDRRMDYSHQWHPPTDDWLDFLKRTVAAGKGWDREDVHF
ncbi:hypothetical protein R3P38DRAFT_2833735 [Favolaschia claudopus]|uniref:MYND-type domain-containing protein n=1 Tax=Favolaschia claudopus TaxID=2862362 RepID=A0AAW0EDG8_9AGAR